MNLQNVCEWNYIIEEIVSVYTSLRKKGLNRESSIQSIMNDFRKELDDEDDRPFVWIGIAVSLCQKQELTDTIMIEARKAIQILEKQETSCNERTAFYNKLKDCISGKSIGEEARYIARKGYNPDWKIGDTFIHPLLQNSAKKAGIWGEYVVLRKVGEYKDRSGHFVQIVYTTICSEDDLPRTDSQLNSLGFLRVMEHFGKWDYLCQITFKSKKDEESWKLKRIGCFPFAGIPSDAAEEDLLVSMPLFGRRKNTDLLGFEDQISLFYRQYGIQRNIGNWAMEQSAAGRGHSAGSGRRDLHSPACETDNDQ